MDAQTRQALDVACYLVGQYLRRQRRFPLVLMLEPLFRCNLACPGCGKIDYSDDILNRRLSTQQCLDAVDECGAPIVSIPGGEPLIHNQMPDIVAALIKRNKYIYLCTNGLLLEKNSPTIPRIGGWSFPFISMGWSTSTIKPSTAKASSPAPSRRSPPRANPAIG